MVFPIWLKYSFIEANNKILVLKLNTSKICVYVYHKKFLRLYHVYNRKDTKNMRIRLAQDIPGRHNKYVYTFTTRNSYVFIMFTTRMSPSVKSTTTDICFIARTWQVAHPNITKTISKLATCEDFWHSRNMIIILIFRFIPLKISFLWNMFLGHTFPLPIFGNSI